MYAGHTHATTSQHCNNSLVLLWGGPQHWNGELLLPQLGIQQTIKCAIEHVKTKSYSNHKYLYMANIHACAFSFLQLHLSPFFSLPSLSSPLPHSFPASAPSFLLPSHPCPFPKVTPLLSPLPQLIPSLPLSLLPPLPPPPSPPPPHLSSFFLTFW